MVKCYIELEEHKKFVKNVLKYVLFCSHEEQDRALSWKFNFVVNFCT